MGDPLAEGSESQKGSDGGSRSVVCANWRAEHGASSLAICRLGGKKGEEGNELGSGGMGGHRAQDCAVDSDDEE